MSSYIENYCGSWKNKSGNRLEISLNANETVAVNFYRAGEDSPMLRPWLNNIPAENMLGTLHPEGGSLDINLSENKNSFCLNLNFDFSGVTYRKVAPSIIRYEDEGYLDQYYDSIGPLEAYEKC